MGRIILGTLFIFTVNVCFAQFASSGDLPAFNYKLDYNVPESPAFSVLGANPTTVMRGSASQEVIVNLASQFFSGGNADAGLALDFNPYFVFGGRLQSVDEYRNSTIKRLLANMQLSFATINDNALPDDLLMATGIRVTLFDTKDPLYDVTLGQEIDKILADANSGDILNDDFDDTDTQMISVDFSPAYESSKRKYKNTAGGSLSLGGAIAIRAKDQSLAIDSLQSDKSQLWVSGQYDFGTNGLSMTGMLMYERMDNETQSRDGVLSGLAIRQYRDDMILNAELMYDSAMRGFEAGGLLEYYKIDNIVVYASFSYRVNEATGKYERIFRPGIKWNISEQN